MQRAHTGIDGQQKPHILLRVIGNDHREEKKADREAQHVGGECKSALIQKIVCPQSLHVRQFEVFRLRVIVLFSSGR